MKKIKLQIKGMTCAGCSNSVENLLNQLQGIHYKKIDYKTGIGIIEFSEEKINETQIIDKINEGHYPVEGSNPILTSDKKQMQCPVCQKKGEQVPNSVFKSVLTRQAKKMIDMSKKYYICLTPDCPIAYFNSSLSINISMLKRELWYKTQSKRKIICYCNNIDRKQIEYAVLNKNLNTWEQITSFYRKKVIEKCETLNPLGICCRNLFNDEVKKVKDIS